MMPVKDLFDIASGIVTSVGVASAAVSYLMGRREQKAKGLTAISQINQMSTNCFPTMQRNLVEQTEQLHAVLNKSDKQIELLTNINTNIAVLVDRPRS